LTSGLLASFRRVLGFAWLNGIVAAKRNPLWVLSYLITPLSLLVLFFVWGGEKLAANAVVGGLVSMAAMNGIGLMGDVAYYKNVVKLQDMMVASPMRSFEYMFGLSMSGFLFSIPGLATMLAFSSKFLEVSATTVGVILLVYFLLLLSSSGIGFTIATFVREERYVWPLSNILSFALMILPPVYYPFTLLPRAMWALAALVPTSASAMLIHYYTGLIDKLPCAPVLVFALLAIEGALFLWISVARSQWREK